ncbi:RING-type E3 ubiquitin transferase [Ranunculus cassubicifolius]
MEDISESDIENSYTGGSSRRRNSGQVSGAASNSIEAFIDQVGSSTGNEVVERRVMEPSDDVTLRQWLDKPDRSVELSQCLHIFRQIVEIVRLAHSQGISVNSVRPSCFLLSAFNHISFIKNVSIPSRSSDLRVDVREPEESNTSLAEISWYTSPEEFTGAPSSISSDIYRLGVLLFELVCPFSTIEEKLSTMLNLRHRVLPPQLLLKWPKEASFCLWLLHPQSSTRPKMSELLQSEFLNEPMGVHDTVTRLRVDIDEQELLLEFLLQMQQQKKESASKLRATVACLSSDIEEVLQNQPIHVREGDCSRSKQADDQSLYHISTDRVLSLGSRKRIKREVQVTDENRIDRYSDGIQKSETMTEFHESMRRKSTQLTKNFMELEKVYCSMRLGMVNKEEKFLKKCSGSSSNNRGSIVVNRGKPVNDVLEKRSKEDRKKGRINPFLDGLNSYLSFSELKVRVDMNQGDLLNSANLVCSLNFDRDNEYFATAGVARKIKVFEYQTILNDDHSIHYPVIEMASKSKLSSVCWNSYIKSQMATCDFEGVVQIWDVSRGQAVLEMREHERRAWSVDISSADPKKLASGSDDASVKLWNINQGESIGSIRTKANVCCVQFPPGSAHSLVFGSADHKIYCYDLRNAKMPWCTLVGHAKTVSYVKFIDSTTLVSASTDNSLKLWDLAACTSQAVDNPLQTFRGHSNSKPPNIYVRVCAEDNIIRWSSYI